MYQFKGAWSRLWSNSIFRFCVLQWLSNSFKQSTTIWDPVVICRIYFCLKQCTINILYRYLYACVMTYWKKTRINLCIFQIPFPGWVSIYFKNFKNIIDTFTWTSICFLPFIMPNKQRTISTWQSTILFPKCSPRCSWKRLDLQISSIF